MEIGQPRPVDVEAGLLYRSSWAGSGQLELEATRIIGTGSPRLWTGNAGAHGGTRRKTPWQLRCLTLRGLVLALTLVDTESSITTQWTESCQRAL